MSQSRHPGPSDLDTSKLTRNELGAFLEHIFYRMKGDTRADLAKRMPGAYQRLTGMSDGAMSCLLSTDIQERRKAGADFVKADDTYSNGLNDTIKASYLHIFEGAR